TALGARPVATDLAASAGVARSAMAVAPHAFPASSCQGFSACDGVTGTVGINACNDDYACSNAGSVGSNACNGFQACFGAGNVGTGACNAFIACGGAQGN